MQISIYVDFTLCLLKVTFGVFTFMLFIYYVCVYFNFKSQYLQNISEGFELQILSNTIRDQWEINGLVYSTDCLKPEFALTGPIRADPNIIENHLVEPSLFHMKTFSAHRALDPKNLFYGSACFLFDGESWSHFLAKVSQKRKTWHLWIRARIENALIHRCQSSLFRTSWLIRIQWVLAVLLRPGLELVSGCLLSTVCSIKSIGLILLSSSTRITQKP